jgi:hypothetical protein
MPHELKTMQSDFGHQGIPQSKSKAAELLSLLQGRELKKNQPTSKETPPASNQIDSFVARKETNLPEANFGFNGFKPLPKTNDKPSIN